MGSAGRQKPLDNRVPPAFPLPPGPPRLPGRPQLCRRGRGARLPPATKNRGPVRGLGLGTGLPSPPAEELMEGRRGGGTDDFICFRGDSQFVQLLITRAPELEFHG